MAVLESLVFVTVVGLNGLFWYLSELPAPTACYLHLFYFELQVVESYYVVSNQRVRTIKISVVVTTVVLFHVDNDNIDRETISRLQIDSGH
jgi:hypothetical protein